MTHPAAGAFRATSAGTWTRERLDQLGREELLNLRANADRLGERELVVLCDELIEKRPLRGPRSSGAGRGAKGRQKLLPRSRAFGARGVYLADARTSWSGVRKTDGMVVMAIWHGAVQADKGGCSCLLWAPNTAGDRPWSDSAAGRERLEHCKLAMQRRGAEGLLVHGDPMEGRLPEDKARSVRGIDADTVVIFQVEQRGNEYWASWGRKAEQG